MANKKIIFCGDDFGASIGVNQGLIKAFINGPIRRFSVFATGFALDHGAKLLDNLGKIKPETGLHFSLTAGFPLTKQGRELNPGSEFFPLAKKIFSKGLFGRLDPEIIRHELSAQYLKIKHAGIKIDYIDGHHHVHLLPGVIECVIDLVLEKGIKRIRLVGEPFFTPPRRSLFSRFLLWALSKRAKKLIEKRTNLNTEEKTAGLCLWKINDYEKGLKTLIQNLPDGIWEIFSHPRIPDKDFITLEGSHFSPPDPGPNELKVLSSPGFNDWLKNNKNLFVV